jgi:hypothetical protein
MHETLKLDNDNSDFTNEKDWLKEHLFKYYHMLDNTEKKKQNNNRTKEFRYKKPEVKDFTPYQEVPWKKTILNHQNQISNGILIILIGKLILIIHLIQKILLIKNEMKIIHLHKK